MTQHLAHLGHGPSRGHRCEHKPQGEGPAGVIEVTEKGGFVAQAGHPHSCPCAERHEMSPPWVSGVTVPVGQLWLPCWVGSLELTAMWDT